MSLQKLAVLLGHSDIKMTMVYAHLVPENVVTEALDILNARPRMSSDVGRGVPGLIEGSPLLG